MDNIFKPIEVASDNIEAYLEGWNAALEAAALSAVANGDHLEIHSPRIAAEIRKLKK